MLTTFATRPIIGITMGDPSGIGPEIIIKALNDSAIHEICRPLVIGDADILKQALILADRPLLLNMVDDPGRGKFQPDILDILDRPDVRIRNLVPSIPSAENGFAMLDYINKGMELARQQRIHGLVTCPITKTALKMAGSEFHGHTELLAHGTGTRNFAMMLAGNKLRVVLVTIHIPLAKVPGLLTREIIQEKIRLTHLSLRKRFSIEIPRIAVAGLNPHSGEGGLFGQEEADIIQPAVQDSQQEGIVVQGPLPPDTVFYHAAQGKFDAVVCMYHDQGLIPFKLLHFRDGVNTTLGLPIIRTSVDHGTAYDIAWKGIADPSSLKEAVRMAAFQAKNQQAGK